MPAQITVTDARVETGLKGYPALSILALPATLFSRLAMPAMIILASIEDAAPCTVSSSQFNWPGTAKDAGSSSTSHASDLGPSQRRWVDWRATRVPFVGHAELTLPLQRLRTWPCQVAR